MERNFPLRSLPDREEMYLMKWRVKSHISHLLTMVEGPCATSNHLLEGLPLTPAAHSWHLIYFSQILPMKEHQYNHPSRVHSIPAPWRDPGRSDSESGLPLRESEASALLRLSWARVWRYFMALEHTAVTSLRREDLEPQKAVSTTLT